MGGNTALGKRNPPQAQERMKLQLFSGFPPPILPLSEKNTSNFACLPTCEINHFCVGKKMEFYQNKSSVTSIWQSFPLGHVTGVVILRSPHPPCFLTHGTGQHLLSPAHCWISGSISPTSGDAGHQGAANSFIAYWDALSIHNPGYTACRQARTYCIVSVVTELTKDQHHLKLPTLCYLSCGVP